MVVAVDHHRAHFVTARGCAGGFERGTAQPRAKTGTVCLTAKASSAVKCGSERSR